jgi:competence protein ComEA
LASLKTKQAAANQKKYNARQEDNDLRPYDHPSGSHYTTYASKSKGTLFYFDPNTLPAEGFKKLGLRDKTITTILNFRSKGGKFRQPSDIKKIWGLFPDEAERLLPFVQIAALEEKSFSKNYPSYPSDNNQKNTIINSIEINGADTAAFISLPGIGIKLSQRIINFRDKLGGFYTVDQVGETFGLPDSVFKKIKPLLQISGEVKKININTASLDELKAHPYIKYHLANAMVQYRLQHGDYEVLEDLKKIMIINEEVYKKMLPYLTLN